MATERTIMHIKYALGDAVIPVEVTVHETGLILVDIGANDSMCDVAQLSEFIGLLTVARDTAVQLLEDK